MSAEVVKITTEEQYEKAVEQIEGLWGSQAGTPEHQALAMLVSMIQEYEDSSGELIVVE